MTTSPLRDRAEAARNRPGTDVATQADAPQSIGALIMQMRPEIQRALPKHLDEERMARMALTVVRQTPKLAECTPASFAGALLTAAALGLDIGPGGEAYLVPYKRECTLIVGYQGLAKLFWQSPLAKHLDAQAVYERDEFDYAYGLGQYLRHKPARGDRGDVVAYYAVAELTTGGSAFVVLSPEEVKKLRQGKVGTSGDIADPQRWMERKTALRQLLKTLPRSATLNTAITVDEQFGSQLYRDRLADHQAAVTVTQVEQPTITASPATGDDPDPEPPAAASNGSHLPAMTAAQKKKLHAQFAELNIDTHEGRVQYAADVLKVPVESTSDLSREAASAVIDAQNNDLAWVNRNQAEPPEEDQ